MLRTRVNTDRRETFRQTRFGAEVAFIRHFGLRVEITHLVRTRTNTVATSNAARSVYTHNPILITPGSPGRTYLNARRIVTVLTGLAEVVIQRFVVVIRYRNMGYR